MPIVTRSDWDGWAVGDVVAFDPRTRAGVAARLRPTREMVELADGRPIPPGWRVGVVTGRADGPPTTFTVAVPAEGRELKPGEMLYHYDRAVRLPIRGEVVGFPEDLPGEGLKGIAEGYGIKPGDVKHPPTGD